MLEEDDRHLRRRHYCIVGHGDLCKKSTVNCADLVAIVTDGNVTAKCSGI